LNKREPKMALETLRRSTILSSITVTLFVSICLWGCGVADWLIGGNIDVNGSRGTLTQEHAAIGGNKYTQALLGNKNAFDKVDIVPSLTGGVSCGSSLTTSSFPEDADADYQCVAWAFRCFYTYPWGVCPNPPNSSGSIRVGQVSPPTPIPLSDLFKADNQASLEALRLRRNALQERLIAASNSGCRVFTQHLNTYQSYTNLFLGAAAVGTGAAGAIVTSVTAARALAGTTGALSGTRAEYNADLFAKNLVSTIVQAIDESRVDYLVTLRGQAIEGTNRQLFISRNQANSEPTASPTAGAMANPVVTPIPNGTLENVPPKQSLSIVDYPVEAAIADAIYYNDLCSLDKGLETLTKSLTTYNHPGLDETLDAIQKMDTIRGATQGGAFAAPTPSATPSPTTSGRIQATLSGSFQNTASGSLSPTVILTIKNLANAPLKVTSITASPQFHLPDGLTSLSLAARSKQDIPVVFAPTATGVVIGTIQIQSSDSAQSPKVIVVSGTGT
jgi:hypothetical protein